MSIRPFRMQRRPSRLTLLTPREPTGLAHGSFGPFRPGTLKESGKSPTRIRKGVPVSRPRGAQESQKSAPRSPKRVQKESEGAFLDSFRTLPFRTRFGLFRGSGPEGPERTLCQASKFPTHAFYSLKALTKAHRVGLLTLFAPALPAWLVLNVRAQEDQEKQPTPPKFV